MDLKSHRSMKASSRLAWATEHIVNTYLTETENKNQNNKKGKEEEENIRKRREKEDSKEEMEVEDELGVYQKGGFGTLPGEKPNVA